MKEALLHYLWKFRKLGDAAKAIHLVTTAGDTLEVIKTGAHNELSGPDFFNAQIRINTQVWVGNVEIHLKSSDWYAHHHEIDAAYSNVILHVVWEEDCDVYDVSNNPIPTLELKDKISPALLSKYQRLLEAKTFRFINCENDFAAVPNALTENWIERMYFERLERKVLEVENLLEKKKGDWEAVLFAMLARNFGTVVNADAFEELASLLPFKTIRKLAGSKNQLEAVFLGVSGLLENRKEGDAQTQMWKTESDFNRHKFNLEKQIHHQIQFFKLRPPNFPTIRVSQLAQLYENRTDLFALVISAKSRNELLKLFEVKASEYWDTHYNFNKEHSKRNKKLATSFIDLLLINSILPVKFAYAKSLGVSIEEELMELITSIPGEQNTILKEFNKLKMLKKDALHSQGLLELKKKYCNVNKCLSCQLGNYILNIS